MIYFDANASSRLRPGVTEAMKGLLRECAVLGNPSSVHAAGRLTSRLLDKARRSVLRLCFPGGKRRGEVIFTSGGTEACNHMIYGFLGLPGYGPRKWGHVVTSAVEHFAVLEVLHRLEHAGIEVSRVKPDSAGICEVERILAQVRPSTRLVTLMGANNVSGAVQPVARLAERLRCLGFRGAIVSDMVQGGVHGEVSVEELFNSGVDAVALSAHKFGGPQGVGAVVLSDIVFKQRVFQPLLLGGAQEQRCRAGTENMLGIIGFAEAAEEVAQDGSKERARKRELRELLWQGLQAGSALVERVSPEDDDGSRLLANTLAIRLPGLRADDLLVALDLAGLCVSSGSACASGKQEVSHVFRAMGYVEEEAREILRLSIDWDATEETVWQAVQIFHKVVAQFERAAEASGDSANEWREVAS